MGIRKLLFPDTIASAALSFEASLMYGWYPLESFRSGGSVAVPVNDSLEITELQAAVLTSKRYSKVEPYGGLKVFRDYVTLKDKANLGQISGTKDNVSVFAGAKLYVFPREALIIEGSVLGETSITIAWNVAF